MARLAPHRSGCSLVPVYDRIPAEMTPAKQTATFTPQEVQAALVEYIRDDRGQFPPGEVSLGFSTVGGKPVQISGVVLEVKEA